MSNNAKVRVLVVDDEPLARDKIKSLLLRDPDVEVTGECSSGTQAVESIVSSRPDLVFLDIEMPEMNGFQVLEAVPADMMPMVIFVTAFDQHAVKAFEVNAIDYVLKPFDRERFQAALERARKRLASRQVPDVRKILSLIEGLQERPRHLERLVVKSGGRIIFLKTDEIDWIEAAGNYVTLHVGKNTHLLREMISNLERQLDPSRFRRIHRSAIVNVDRIRELQAWFRGEYRVILQDNTELTLSRGYREKLHELLGKSF